MDSLLCREIKLHGLTDQERLTYNEDSNDANCPQSVDQTLPQPSPGVNYRRRGAIERRASIGTGEQLVSCLPTHQSPASGLVSPPEIRSPSCSVPSYTCPFTSTDPDVSVFVVQVESGPGSTRGVSRAADQVNYVCQFPDVSCIYQEDVSTMALNDCYGCQGLA